MCYICIIQVTYIIRSCFRVFYDTVYSRAISKKKILHQFLNLTTTVPLGPRYTHVHFLFRKKVRWILHYFLFTSKSSTGYIIKIIFLYRCQLNGDTMILSYKSLHCSVFIFMLLRKTSESCTVRLNNGWQHIKSSL